MIAADTPPPDFPAYPEHGIWVYGGDGDCTLKVFNLNSPPGPMGYRPVQTISTGGTTRVDEMAVTTDGKLLVAANNAEDPPYATLFRANGDSGISNVSKIIKISVDPTIIPVGFGLSLEQPTWEPITRRHDRVRRSVYSPDKQYCLRRDLRQHQLLQCEVI